MKVCIQSSLCTALQIQQTSSMFLLDIYLEAVREVSFNFVTMLLWRRPQNIHFSPPHVPAAGAPSIKASVCRCNRAKHLQVAMKKNNGVMSAERVIQHTKMCCVVLHIGFGNTSGIYMSNPHCIWSGEREAWINIHCLDVALLKKKSDRLVSLATNQHAWRWMSPD